MTEKRGVFPSCVILADDLTGACDAAVHFAVRGYRTSVAVALQCVEGEAEVLSLNLDSRNVEPAEIAPLMDRARAVLHLEPETILFKKIDSTLRGNAAVETAAAMRAFGCDTAVFTPALPALGRVVQSGILTVTGFAGFEPVHLPSWLALQGLTDCLSPDAVCDEDLDRFVSEARGFPKRILWAGSAGLAAALARALPAKIRSRAPKRIASGPIVFGIGSTHEVTLGQVRELQSARPGALVLTAEDAARYCLAQRPGAVVLSGGDTASMVCRAAGAHLIELEAEILSGIPWGHLRGGVLDGVPVATKSGGFGAPDALIQVSDFFQCPKA